MTPKTYITRSNAEAKALHNGSQTVIVIPIPDQPPEGWSMEIPGPRSASARHVNWKSSGYGDDRRWGKPIPFPYAPGDVIAVKEPMWISDCGRYFARPFYHPEGACGSEYDVVERATGTTWLARRYKPKGWKDKDRRYTHPEFPRMVGYWGNRGRQLRSGRWIKAFELGFTDHDQSIRIDPLKGNTVLASYAATFRKRWPARWMPLALVTLKSTVQSIDCKQVQSVVCSADMIMAWGIVYDADAPVIGPCEADVGNLVEQFGERWDREHADCPWASNPWCWFVEVTK